MDKDDTGLGKEEMSDKLTGQLTRWLWHMEMRKEMTLR